MHCPIRFTLTLTGTLFAATEARAEERPDTPLASLQVSKSDGAKDCPDAAGLADRVAQIAGKPVLDPTPSSALRLSFSVQLTANKAGYSAVLRAKGTRSGVRNIADIGSDCSGLADALAVTLAIILDDERSAPPPAPNPLESFVVQPPAPQSPTPTESAPPPRETPTFWRPFVGAGAALGILDTNALGAVAGLDINIGRLVTGLEVLWLLPHRFDRGPGNATVDLVAVGFHACFQPETDPRRTHLALCAHFTEGRLHGAAEGFTINRSASRPWTAPGVAALVGGEVTSPLEWFVRAKLYFPVRRERFVIDNLGTVHETPLLGALVAAGLALRIE